MAIYSLLISDRAKIVTNPCIINQLEYKRQSKHRSDVDYLDIKRERLKFHCFAERALDSFLFHNERGSVRVALNFQHGVRLLLSERVFHKQVGIPHRFQVVCSA